jgi:hypothetical protein
MNTIDLIQYIERHENQRDADVCLDSLSGLAGYIGGNTHFSPSYRERKEWVAQAFFERHDCNPESLEEMGMRVVCLTPSLLIQLAKK